MAEYIKYKYMFEVSNEITKCSECPFADETYKGCNLYSNGCVDRYHYPEFDLEKPQWCKLKGGLMKQVVIFTPDDLENMRSDVHAALWRLRNKRPLSDDSCSVIERELENVQKILYREDD